MSLKAYTKYRLDMRIAIACTGHSAPSDDLVESRRWL